MPPCMSTWRTHSDHGQAIARAKANDPLRFILRSLDTTNVCAFLLLQKIRNPLFKQKPKILHRGKLKYKQYLTNITLSPEELCSKYFSFSLLCSIHICLNSNAV